MCVCMGVCVRERDRVGEIKRVNACVHVCVQGCVCVRYAHLGFSPQSSDLTFCLKRVKDMCVPDATGC